MRGLALSLLATAALAGVTPAAAEEMAVLVGPIVSDTPRLSPESALRLLQIEINKPFSETEVRLQLVQSDPRDRNDAQQWLNNRDAVAVMWGTKISSSGRLLTSEARVHIGAFEVVDSSNPQRRIVWRSQPETFTVVRGAFPPNVSSGADVTLYQLVLGYAVLIRMWRSEPAQVAPIARLLIEEVGPRARRGIFQGSPCVDELLSRISEIRDAVSASRRPRARALQSSTMRCETR